MVKNPLCERYIYKHKKESPSEQNIYIHKHGKELLSKKTYIHNNGKNYHLSKTHIAREA